MSELDTLIEDLRVVLLREFPTTAQAAQLDAEDLGEQLDLLFFRLPDLFAVYRARALALGVADVYDVEPEPVPTEGLQLPEGLAAWWKGQRRELFALAEVDGIGPEVVAARARSLIEREVTTQLTEQHEAGVVRAADDERVDLVFHPERDACLRCTSYAGAVRAPGEDGYLPVRDFTGGRLGSVPITIPVHPRCRCESRAVYSSAERDDRADALAREAERSVLRFDAERSGDSDRARTEAAARLIAEGSRLGKTVIDRSRRAVKRRQAEEPTRRRTAAAPKGT